MKSLIEDLVERLQNASRFEHAGDLLSQQKEVNVDQAIDCYNKANKFLKAIEIATKYGK